MRKQILYTYLGKNGKTIKTGILLEGAFHVKTYILFAKEGYVLTKDNINFVKQVEVPEDEVLAWKEVLDNKD